LAIGEWRCVGGLIVIILGLVLKMSQEERLMVATFPEAYPQYRHRVKALIPGLF
jgi:protein-S-isoprenylcysteine O-methyltransferase Ste14